MISVWQEIRDIFHIGFAELGIAALGLALVAGIFRIEMAGIDGAAHELPFGRNFKALRC